MTISERIREWVNNRDDSDFVVPIEAAKFVVTEEEQNADELKAWLWEQRHQIVGTHMGAILRQRRARGRAVAFAGSAEDHDELRSFLDVTYTIAGVHRPLRDMNWAELGDAAKEYDARAKANRFEATFLRAVQKRLAKDNSQKVADVFDDEQLRTLHDKAA